MYAFPGEIKAHETVSGVCYLWSCIKDLVGLIDDPAAPPPYYSLLTTQSRYLSMPQYRARIL